MTRLPAVLLLAAVCVAAPRGAVAETAAASDTTPIDAAVDQLRHVIGAWDVTTEFIGPDGEVARAIEGTYRFEWVVPDRVVSGRSDLPELGRSAGILFYVRELDSTIEMVSVGLDGRLWVMSGPASGEVRTTPVHTMPDGTTMKLRFTRYAVEDDRFESKMEFSRDGGETWAQGNHQVFRRADAEG